jgi:putative ABC transport system permease protein
VISQLITENVLLALGGAGCGLLLAAWGVELIRNGMPVEVERFVLGWKQLQLDGRALAFTLLAAVLSGILAGLAPAWQCSRPNLTDALKEGGRGSTVGKGSHRVRQVLVAAQIALAVVLLVGAGLMVRGFANLLRSGDKLEPSTLLSMRLGVTQTKYRELPQAAAFYRQVLERIAALPGVKSAVAVTALPYTGHSSGRDFTIDGRAVERGERPSAVIQAVSGRYFETLHIPLRGGRLLNENDGAEAPRVAVVSERLSRQYWKGESPVGRRIHFGPPDSKNPWMTVVGVVADVMHDVYDRGPRRMLYVPYAQSPMRSMDIGIRTAGDPLRLVPAVTAAIRSVDPEQPITEVRTLERAIRNNAIGLNYVAVLMGVFGSIALVLSAIGVYGVMAYLVSEQTHEIGVRMALGASRGSVLGMVFRRGFTTTVAGVLAGLPIALALARLLASLIVGVAVTDPVSFLGIPLALMAAAGLAIYVPARRATQIDPIVALRYE